MINHRNKLHFTVYSHWRNITLLVFLFVYYLINKCSLGEQILMIQNVGLVVCVTSSNLSRSHNGHTLAPGWDCGFETVHKG